mgnify:CR=1 FL=1
MAELAGSESPCAPGRPSPARASPDGRRERRLGLDQGEMVSGRGIGVDCTGEHPLPPFPGVAHGGYIPATNGKVTGLSKLARLVDLYARRPQVQERITTQVADALVEHLELLRCRPLRGTFEPFRV